MALTIELKSLLYPCFPRHFFINYFASDNLYDFSSYPYESILGLLAIHPVELR
jgi:hypothetical protein